ERVGAKAGLADVYEDGREERDVAVDEVEARLVGFAAQAGGDDVDVAVGRGGVVAGGDALAADHRAAVQEIEGLAGGVVGVGVDELDVRDDAGALQGKRGVGSDAAAAADDGDFHFKKRKGLREDGHSCPSRDAGGTDRNVRSPSGFELLEDLFGELADE